MCFRNCIDVIIMSLYTACSSHNVDAMVQAEDVVVAVVIDGGGKDVMAMVMVVMHGDGDPWQLLFSQFGTF